MPRLNKSFPFEVETALFCESIRQEGSGKASILGAMSGDMLLPTTPVGVPLGIFVVLYAKNVGKTPIVLEFRVNNQVLLQVNADVDIRDTKDPAILAVTPPFPILVQGPGTITAELVVNGERRVIKQREIRIDPSLPMPSIVSSPQLAQSPVAAQATTSPRGKRRPSAPRAGGAS